MVSLSSGHIQIQFFRAFCIFQVHHCVPFKQKPLHYLFRVYNIPSQLINSNYHYSFRSLFTTSVLFSCPFHLNLFILFLSIQTLFIYDSVELSRKGYFVMPFMSKIGVSSMSAIQEHEILRKHL